MPADAGTKWPQYLVTMSVCTAAICVGMALGWTSNIIYCLKLGHLNEIEMAEYEIDWITSLIHLGAMMTCLPTGWLLDTIGRKITLIWLALPFLIGWLFVMLGTEMSLIYVGTIFLGMSCGGYSVVVPLYIIETVHSKIRGTLGTFFHLFITIGILSSGIFGFAMPFTPYNTFCMLIPVIVGVHFFVLPESPVYDLKKQRLERAENTFHKFRGENFDSAEEIGDILFDFQRRKDKPFMKSLIAKATRKAMLICLALMFYQQMSGYYVVMFYSEECFNAAGDMNDSLIVILLQIIQVLATSVSTFAIDRYGRKILLFISALFMSVSTCCIGLFFTLRDRNILLEDTLKKIGFIPVLFLNLFVIAYSIGFGPIPWITASEFFSPALRAKCNAIAATFSWFLAFGVSKSYFPPVDYVGIDITFYVYSFISVTAIFFVSFLMPETRGKTFNEIHDVLET